MNQFFTDLQKYKTISSNIEENQCGLNEIRTLCKNLNGTEDLVREKIQLKKQELETLKCDFINIMDMYARIISLSQLSVDMYQLSDN